MKQLLTAEARVEDTCTFSLKHMERLPFVFIPGPMSNDAACWVCCRVFNAGLTEVQLPSSWWCGGVPGWFPFPPSRTGSNPQSQPKPRASLRSDSQGKAFGWQDDKSEGYEKASATGKGASSVVIKWSQNRGPPKKNMGGFPFDIPSSQPQEGYHQTNARPNA